MKDVRVTRSEAETREFGREIGSTLRGGEILFLRGDFGCGKTVFVKGLAGALGIPLDEVTSPSFTLINIHRGRLTLHHLDLYRIEADSAITELAIEELVRPDSVLTVEWAQHWLKPTLVPDMVLDFVHGGGDDRTITLSIPAR